MYRKNNALAKNKDYYGNNGINNIIFVYNKKGIIQVR